MPLLEVDNLTRRFGGLSAVSDLSFAIEEGEIRGLIGANGAGKSTTLRAIFGLTGLTSDEIRYDGHRIDGLAPEKIVGLGIAQVPEGRRVFPELTVLANQAHALRRAGRDPAARRLFEEALLAWDASAPWVAALAPERRARSSTFHLRLEAKHPGGYARHSRERYEALAAEGRAVLMTLHDEKPPPFDGPARWAKERPEGYTDARKLMAAVLLVAAHRV